MRRTPTLLVPGHPAWRKLNAEKLAALTPDPDTTVEELLMQGQALSASAIELLAAVQRSGDGKQPGPT